MRKVLVSGCFDLLHAGHIAFFKSAAAYGKLYVCIGTDKNVKLLKGRYPLFSQEERAYIVSAIGHVADAFVATGVGPLDYEPEIRKLKPDVFVVNGDGDTGEKKRLCKKYGIEYVVLKREPATGFEKRSSTAAKNELRIPYRISLAGGWIDQPWVSAVWPGSMIVASLESSHTYAERSGMATSTRRAAMEIWGERPPSGDPEKLARILFAVENPPGSPYVSGSQDMIGLMYPGISRLHYDGKYWPGQISSTSDETVVSWLEGVVHLIPLWPRPMGYDPLVEKNLDLQWVIRLGRSGDNCWKSVLSRDVKGFGESLTETLECWRHILPRTVDGEIMAKVHEYDSYPGRSLTGCGGGYIIVISEKPVEGAMGIHIRRG